MLTLSDLTSWRYHNVTSYCIFMILATPVLCYDFCDYFAHPETAAENWMNNPYIWGPVLVVGVPLSMWWMLVREREIERRKKEYIQIQKTIMELRREIDEENRAQLSNRRDGTKKRS
jgi:hypothetical protein